VLKKRNQKKLLRKLQKQLLLHLLLKLNLLKRRKKKIRNRIILKKWVKRLTLGKSIAFLSFSE